MSIIPALVIFRDFDIWYKPDHSGCNKIGYVMQNGIVIYPLRRKLSKVPLKKIKGSRHRFFQISSDFEIKNLESFFNQNMPNVNLFFDGIRAIMEGNFSFFEDPIKLPILCDLRPGEFEKKWTKFVSLLRTGDAVATIDTKSWISRIIAKIDNGTWSHVATYIGRGKICEAIAVGVVERNIEVYRSPRYRLGIYRPMVSEDVYVEGLERVVTFARLSVGTPYDYLGALKLGIKKFLGIRLTRSFAKNITPNDLVIANGVKLIFVC